MKCYNCRAEVGEGNYFCLKCGSPQKFTGLIKKALENDQEATEQIYVMTYNNVYQTIRTVARLDDDTVFDLIQNTYVKAFCNLSQLKEPEAFRGWIKSIARNLTIDHLRKKNVVVFSQMVSVDSDEMIDFEDNKVEHLPEVVMDKSETARLLGEILDSLSEEQRIAVTMYYFEDLSVKEIAEALEVSEGTVKSRLNYGRKKIEAGVKELEKKGTKLYGLAPIPFLLFLLKGQETYAAELPNTMVLQAVQNSLSAGTASSSVSAGVSSAVSKETARTIGKETVKNTAKAVGTEAVKTTVGVAGKAAVVKIIAGVATVAFVGAGAVGIATMNKRENNDLSQKMETQEVRLEDVEIEDFLGEYFGGNYCLYLGMDAGVLSVTTGILPGKNMSTYTYDEFQLDGNTLVAKHTDYSDSYIVNEDGALTTMETDGIDKYILNGDGTIEVEFHGGNELYSGAYRPYGWFSEHEMKLEDIIGDYRNESGMLRLEVVDDELFLRIGNEHGISKYPYDEYKIEGNTLIAKHSQFSEYEARNNDGHTPYDTTSSLIKTDGIDKYVMNDDGTISITLEGTQNWLSGIYSPGAIEIVEDKNIEDFLGTYSDTIFYHKLSYKDGILTLTSGVLPEVKDEPYIYDKETYIYEYDYFQISGNSLYAKHTDYSDRRLSTGNGTYSYTPTAGVDRFMLREDGYINVHPEGELELRYSVYMPYEGSIE